MGTCTKCISHKKRRGETETGERDGERERDIGREGGPSERVLAAGCSPEEGVCPPTPLSGSVGGVGHVAARVAQSLWSEQGTLTGC